MNALGCGGRLAPLDAPASACIGEAPTCVGSTDACAPPQPVSAVCDEPTRAWTCPAGAWTYERAADTPGVCRPFYDAAGPLRSLEGSLARVPLDDGRCLWIGESAQTADGSSVRNVGFVREPGAPFGSCPSSSTFVGGAPVPAVTIDGTSDPSLLVQIDGAYRLGGQTRVFYRLFHVDPTAVFGVTELGSGLGRWDATAQRIVVPGPSSLRWGPDLDLGDASLVASGEAYVWGCHGPEQFLSEPCALARLDGSDAVQLFAGGSRWVSSVRGADAATVFASGPWISSVVGDRQGGLLHVYAVGFASRLETHLAASPVGPWSPGSPLGNCDLPASDGHAFCAGPVVHEELQDPERPGEIVVTYGVGSTTNGDAARRTLPQDYWTRMVWLRR